MKRNLLRILSLAILCGASFIALAPALRAQPEPGSLDAELLEGLNEGLEDLPKPAAPRKPAPADEAPAPNLDQELLEGLGDKEQPTDPVSRISGKMRRAGEMIHRRVPFGEAQTLQQEVVDELEKLLEQARKNSQKSQQSQQNEQQASRDQASQPQGNQTSQANPDQNSNQPARDSEAGTRAGRVEKPDPASTQALMQELWGHLPERDRQQVINSTMETFIPKYETLIKEYFKRLAETTRERN